MSTKKRIGFTTSLPIGGYLAAGHIPVDINNRFVTGNAVQNIHLQNRKASPALSAPGSRETTSLP